jgi:hypothetical protein
MNQLAFVIQSEAKNLPYHLPLITYHSRPHPDPKHPIPPTSPTL